MEQCRYITWVGPLLDGELDEQRRQELAAHLPTCEQCSTELAELRRLSGMIETELKAAIPPLPGEAMQRFHEQVDALGDRSLRRLAEALSGIAAAILVVCSLWLLRTPRVSASEQLPPWYSAVALRPQPTAMPQSMQTAQWIAAELSSEPNP